MKYQIIAEFPGGELQIFGAAQIQTLNAVLATPLSGSELVVDQLTAIIDVRQFIQRFVPDGSTGLLTANGELFYVQMEENDVLAGPADFTPWPYGTLIWCWADGQLLGGRFYASRMRRVGINLYEVTAVSDIGILGAQTHTGGIYTGQTFAEILADIVGSSIPYTVSPDLASLPMYGWLPYQSRRDSLHQLLFPIGASVGRNSDGSMAFRFPDAADAGEIPDRRIFYGGSVNYLAPVDRVEILEHTFFASDADKDVVLFDNTDGSASPDVTTVIFREAPVHDITVSGSLTILEQSCNHAVVQGVGTLTGKAYSHATRLVENIADEALPEPNSITVSDAYMVSLANSQNVAKRMLAYYSAAHSVRMDIIWDGERPGDQITFTNPFREKMTAFLSTLEIRAGSFLRSTCELIAGYTPQAMGNNYNRVVVLSGSGSWTPPVGVSSGLCVIIGAGDGGYSGMPGKAGQSGTRTANGLGGAGGKEGQGGLGGKVLTVEVSFDGTAIAYSCGLGGEGAAAGEESLPGAAGGDTIFGAYSSASGQRSATGVTNLFTGELLGGNGKAGIPGGRGAQPDAVFIGSNQVLSGGEAGESVAVGEETFSCGANGSSAVYAFNAAGGGAGGGAAYGSDGADGSDGVAENYSETIGPDSAMITVGGKGGKGADAIPNPDALAPGSGGRGGNGGGGGGGGGGAGYIYGAYGSFVVGAGGERGLGSEGSRGADGLILIYIKEAS